ncbi:MAG TPA: metal ABC transporter ATP-binding protein [Phycisphaerae bacterium]|nr:metal ABC transporter ATP-binding protein [Phycisphaerae bacterium]
MSDTRLPNEAAVAFEDVTVAPGGYLILDGVTARVPLGSCTAIVGPNGAGKTTMLLALLGQIPYRGRIHVACQTQERHSRIGYVPQRLQFDRGLPMTVLEFMVMGWQRMPLYLGVRKNHRKRAMALLTSVKADALAQRRIGALSGGEMQRVLLALAIGQKPDLLVLDEPAAGVDFQGEHVFCELLEGLRRELGFTLLMVSHDLVTVTHHATHVICLNRRVIAEGPPRETLTPENLTAIFGVHMGLVDGRALPDDRAECSASCCKGGRKHA